MVALASWRLVTAAAALVGIWVISAQLHQLGGGTRAITPARMRSASASTDGGVAMAPLLGGGFTITVALSMPGSTPRGAPVAVFKPLQTRAMGAGAQATVSVKKCAERLHAHARVVGLASSGDAAWCIPHLGLAEFAAAKLAQVLRLEHHLAETQLWGVCADDLVGSFRAANATAGLLARLQHQVVGTSPYVSRLCGGGAGQGGPNAQGILVVGARIAWQSHERLVPMAQDAIPAVCSTDMTNDCASQQPLPGVDAFEWTDVAIFDFLIGNTDRYNGGNLFVVANASSQPQHFLWIDHEAADVTNDYSSTPSFMRDPLRHHELQRTVARMQLQRLAGTCLFRPSTVHTLLHFSRNPGGLSGALHSSMCREEEQFASRWHLRAAPMLLAAHAPAQAQIPCGLAGEAKRRLETRLNLLMDLFRDCQLPGVAPPP